MAVLSDYTSGTITLANGSTAVTGTGTLFDVAKFREGDTLQIQNLTAVIASVDSNTQLTLTAPWTGTSLTDAPYRARYLPDGARVTAQATTLIELLGNGVLSNLAEIGVEDGKVPVGNAAGEYELKDQSTFGIQDPNGSLGKIAALTLAANKAVTTDGSGNAQQIDLGTLGRALLALASGTTAQYVQGDGTLQAKSSLPVSSATQTALDGKVNRSGDTGLTGNYTTTGATRANSISAQTIIGADQGLRAGLYASYAGYCELAGPRVNGAVGTQNFTGTYSGNIGGSSLSFSLFGVERVGTEVIASLKVQSGSIQAYFEFSHQGALRVPGAFTAGSKSFKIDHVKDPYNKYLVYMSTEAPKAGIEDWGSIRLVNGQAEVDLDISANQMHGTFAALTQKAVVVSLNNLDGDTRLRAGRIVDGKFTIHAIDNPDCDDEVIWHVKAERADPFIKSHPYCNPETGLLIPEHEKED